MRNKLIIGVLMLASTLVILPAAGFAATNEKINSVTVSEFSPQIRVRVGNGRRNRKWNRGRHYGWRNKASNRTRLVRQVYYVNGRKFVRWVKVRY
jgi:hypothetical protein